jgi:hypothetical protein
VLPDSQDDPALGAEEAVDAEVAGAVAEDLSPPEGGAGLSAIGSAAADPGPDLSAVGSAKADGVFRAACLDVVPP